MHSGAWHTLWSGRWGYAETIHRTEARAVVMHELYCGVVDIEVRTMIDMIRQHVIPCALKVKDRLPAGILAKLDEAITVRSHALPSAPPHIRTTTRTPMQ